MPDRKTKVTKTTKGTPARPSPSPSLRSLPPGDAEGFIPPHGGYQKLLSYQKALVVYQATLLFCDRFIDKKTFKKGIEHPDPAICVNVIVGLIKVTNYLLDQQLRRLEQAFLREGGLRERMTRARLAARARQGPWK
jgi:four helix bundle suffix protein